MSTTLIATRHAAHIRRRAWPRAGRGQRSRRSQQRLGQSAAARAMLSALSAREVSRRVAPELPQVRVALQTNLRCPPPAACSRGVWGVRQRGMRAQGREVQAAALPGGGRSGLSSYGSVKASTKSAIVGGGAALSCFPLSSLGIADVLCRRRADARRGGSVAGPSVQAARGIQRGARWRERASRSHIVSFLLAVLGDGLFLNLPLLL